MSGQRPIDALSRSEGRRVATRTAARIIAGTLVLLVLYAVLPLPLRVGVGAVLALAAGLIVLVAVIAIQVRAIGRSPQPGMRAIEAMALTLTVLVVVFAYVYVSLSAGLPSSFSEPLSRLDGVYFTVTTLATVGFGDIAARTQPARLIVTLQIVVDLALIAGLARLFADVVRRHVGEAR